MFVLEALVLTFMTTPLVTWFYPHIFVGELPCRVRTPAIYQSPDNEAVARNQRVTNSGLEEDSKTRFTVVLDKLEHLPEMMALTQLIQPPLPEMQSFSMQRDAPPRSITDSLYLRLIELSDRVSAVMKSSVSDTLLLTDPMLSIFRMFGHLNGIRVSLALSIVKFNDLAYNVAEHAKNHDSDMILIPWLPPVHKFEASRPLTPTVDARPLVAPPITLNPTGATNNTASGFRSNFSHYPFDIFFRSSGVSGMPGSSGGEFSSSISFIHSQFVRGVFSQC